MIDTGDPNIQIVPFGQGWRFEWLKEQIWIETRRVFIHRDERAIAEIMIGTSRSDFGPKLLSPTDVNLKAERTKDQLAKTLAERFPFEDPAIPGWQRLINKFSEVVLDLVRHGDEVETFWGNEDVPEPQWAMLPFLPKGQPAAIYGDGDVGKSTFALPIALTCLLPWLDNPWGWIPSSEPLKFLYLDWEWSREDVRWRWWCLLKGYDLEMTPLAYRRCRRPLTMEFEGIQLAIEKEEAQGVIIDSLGRACGGDLNASDPVMAYFEAVSQLRQKNGDALTILALGHNSKDRDAKDRTLYGNQFFTTQHRSIWEMRKVQEQGENHLDIGLFHKKKNRSAYFPPRAYRINWETASNPKTLTMDKLDVGIAFADQLSAFSQVQSALKRGPRTVKEMAEETGLAENAIRVALSRHKTSFLKLPDAEWGLLSPILSPGPTAGASS